MPQQQLVEAEGLTVTVKSQLVLLLQQSINHAMHRRDRSGPEHTAGRWCEGHRHITATIGHSGRAIEHRYGGAR